jgi:hypothetical protein
MAKQSNIMMVNVAASVRRREQRSFESLGVWANVMVADDRLTAVIRLQKRYGWLSICCDYRRRLCRIPVVLNFAGYFTANSRSVTMQTD